MEYMHIVLHKLKSQPNFNFHAKCEKMDLIHLSFVDDLLLFSRGDQQSVEMVMQAFNDFSKAIGLVVNPSKCKLFFGNVEGDIKQKIQEIIGFAEGCLPFRYLGIPITSKKLVIVHYLPIIEKVMARINHWSSRLLSFAGKTQLIKGVLFALTNYWLQCLPLPKKVI
ncbi:uncharacterized protein LOC131615016 [Vicia villosa]|uniref:uncharacterized protein LOC131615016 n=1 Tax=Vicia villosa TaxID=3911 RepID=UPI00273A9F0F|nr:uncharacterized protein LOC131615016 [Vicia villosa]